MSLRGTYRLQFHKEFTFADAERRVPYFASLGVSHIYSSPILTARAGSVHGYDVVDPARINGELGGEPAFRSFAAALRAQGLGIVLDIVPNHMAIGGADNPYWLDLLEKGRESVFANMFDIDWDTDPSATETKVIVPRLGRPLAECLSAGEISLVWDSRLDKLAIAYGDHRYPVRLDDYSLIIGDSPDPDHADLSRFLDPKALAALLARQHYRLVFWRDAGDRINWRRFFDITDLAAVRVEDDAVFEQTHATIFRLFGEGLIDGVRVDHVDGLADPAAYCRRLRARLEALTLQRPVELPREPAIVIVEKILAQRERLPTDWGVDGTTGYDFMNAMSGLQHDPASEAAFTALWTATSQRAADFECEERRARREMLDGVFANAVRTTAAAFSAIESSGNAQVEAYQRGLSALIESFSAYRTYATGDSTGPPPGEIFDHAVDAARIELAGDRDAFDAVGCMAATMRGERAEQTDLARDAVRRFNQLAAPVAAKAVEDTAFYRYGRLLSRNDVGCSPGRFAIPPSDVHATNGARAAVFPLAFLATATHDHKRGEDTRARLAALSELPDAWRAVQREWFEMNAPLRPAGVAPGDEYQLYQTVVGSWPLTLAPDDGDGTRDFCDRILHWREKSLREAKLDTSWAEPDTSVEGAHREFVQRMLDPSHGFLRRLATFVEWLAPAGALNGLAATVLRYTSPGVPDLYQGTDLWDLSLVDPDNRRPVDFELRAELLGDARRPAELIQSWKTGGVKLSLIRRLLALRARIPELFGRSEYQPIVSNDPRIFAFARTTGEQTLFVAVPRLCANVAIARGIPLPGDELGTHAELSLPVDWSGYRWRDGLDPETPDVVPLSGAPLFSRLPAAVFFSE